jgi:hypothetical protein
MSIIGHDSAAAARSILLNPERFLILLLRLNGGESETRRLIMPQTPGEAMRLRNRVVQRRAEIWECHVGKYAASPIDLIRLYPPN